MNQRLKRVAAAIAGATAGVAMAAATCAPASAGPSLLIDVETGRVLYAQNQDQPWHPASLTKVMTAYLTFVALKEGKLTKEQEIATSELAHGMPPSKIGLPIGGTMTVDLALQSLIVKSANDVAVMLAEAIDGSVEAFADRMNKTARRLGMTATSFVNPNGLPAEAQITSARDLALLTRAVMREFPEHAHYWSSPGMKIGKIRLRSHNSLLKTFAGTTGLKTGFICDSGFNIVASAERDGRHLAAVVLGEPTPADRAARAAMLLEHGFSTYEWKVLLKAPTLAELPVDRETATAPSIRADIKVWDCRAGNTTAERTTRRPKQREASAAKTKDAKPTAQQ